MAERICRILMESDSEKELLSDSSEFEDHLRERSQNSDTEQNAGDESDGEENVPLAYLQTQDRLPSPAIGEMSDSQILNSFYIGKGGLSGPEFLLYNKFRQAPEVSPVAKSEQTELECWSLFYYNFDSHKVAN